MCVLWLATGFRIRSLVASGGEEDGPAVEDTDREDLETLASLQRSITMARALFHK